MSNRDVYQQVVQASQDRTRPATASFAHRLLAQWQHASTPAQVQDAQRDMVLFTDALAEAVIA